ncbi:MAG: site-2 protease family protein [Anaerolineales bacterium]|nr:site-2 protease family protein [Anaerolineales bacterium]MCB8954825.1 site-2 protease family protein [Ardenticatenales bacterium]
MRRNNVPLGKILGIPIGLDYSWFLVFGLLTWTLATSYYPNEFSNWSTTEYWIVGALTAILLFTSVVLHELGHSVVAMHYQIRVRSITLFIFGGVAQIESEPPSAKSEFWIAIAGPAVSLALAGIFFIVQPLAKSITPLLALCKYLAYINGSLVLFNLIPGFPLDGGRVFRAIVWGVTKNLRRATQIAGSLGRFIGFLFIFFGVWQMFSGNFVDGLWIAFIGWFLESAAVAQIQQQEFQALLSGHKVSEAMNQSYTAVDAGTPLDQLVGTQILGRGQRSFIVEQNAEAVGLLTLHHIKEIPPAEWPITTAGQIMIPIANLKQISPTTPLWQAMELMDRDGVNQLPVTTDGHLRGMFSREDLISYLRTLHELET